MASKMSTAYDANGNLITIEMAEQGQYVKPLHCQFCDASVSFVNGYPRQIGEDTIAVQPFFRLNKDRVHSENCRYNVEGQIRVIVRESEGDVLAAIGNNRFELRLLAVKKEFAELKEVAEQKKKAGQEASTGSATDKVYQSSGKSLGAYINSAKRVLKVRSACSEHSEIEAALQLVFDGVRVPWNDFYFEDEDYFRCYTQLKNSSVHYPIAIHGTVKKISVVNGKKGKKYAVLNLMGPYRKTDLPDTLDSACVSIWSHELNAFSDYSTGEQIIAFGMWELAPPQQTKNTNPQPGSPIKTFINYRITLWPVTRSQLCSAL